MPGCIPTIVTCFDNPQELGNHSHYQEIIRNILRKIVPSNLFSRENAEHQYELFKSHLPFVTSTLCSAAPGKMSFFILVKYRSNAFKFFFEMISRWLVPGKRLNVVLIYAADFRMPDVSHDLYTLCEVMIHVEDKHEYTQILTNLPIIESEVKLGIMSGYYARRILEIKGLAADEKTAMIQECITYLVKRLPKSFDIDVLTEMQHALVMCRDDFKASRESRHLSRIISGHYLFRRAIRDAIKEVPDQRYLFVKLFKTLVRHSGSFKQVVGVLVGVNFIRDKEIFEKKHIIAAIQNHIPGAHVVEGSYFANRRGSEPICTFYLEIEKINGQQFTNEEIRLLRQVLPAELKDRIEHPMHPVFMPRNEEEIMRNILSLSNQIKFLRDIPQVIITFDEQTHADLSFTVIIVRVMTPGCLSIQEMFKKSPTMLEYIHDRCKMVGYLRNKYTKEATVFRVKMPKELFLRSDHSIDLYKARQTVVSELSGVIGEFRDFNGGMITKQNELLDAVKGFLGEEIKYSGILLENFFFSLTPVAMRTLLEPEALKTLFVMLLEAIESGFSNSERYKIRQEPDFVYILMGAETQAVQEVWNRELQKFNLHSTELATSSVTVHEVSYVGYIYRCSDVLKQQQFLQAYQNLVPCSK